MTRHALAAGYQATVVVSMLATMMIGVWRLRARSSTDDGSVKRVGALWAHPLAQLAIVCVLLLVNQIIFNVYVLRAHGGDASFLSRYLGHGWCVLEQGTIVRALASISGNSAKAVGWMSFSVLRVQAFLELPFTLFAYLAVARLLSGHVYRSLTRLPVLMLASLSFTSAFSLTELALANPWTSDDLFVRGVACAVVPVYVAWTARRHAPPVDDRELGAFGLIVFLGGAGAIAILVLAVYDVFLLYNLGHLREEALALTLPWAVAALAARRAGRLRESLTPSPSLSACRTALGVFALLFFVPSLAIRYWSFHEVAQISGLLLVAVSLIAGVVAALRVSSPRPIALRLVACAAGVVAGVFCAVLVAQTRRLDELTLALVALAFLVPAVLVSRAVELLVPCSTPRPLCDGLD